MNKDPRDWDRNDRDRDSQQQPQRPAYKILERNRGDSESSKDSRGGGDSSSNSRNNRFGGNDCDTVPVRLHRDANKDSSKRLSSDSGRLVEEDPNNSKGVSPKGGDHDSMDSSYDSLRGGSNKDESTSNKQTSSYARGPTRHGGPFTSSWADEVDQDQDDYQNNSSSDMDSNSRKGSLIRDLKRGDHYQVHPSQEEMRRPMPQREMPRRVIIQQTKVENMKSSENTVVKPKEAPQVPPQQQQQQEPQKTEPVKIQEKPIIEREKSKGFTAWGDRKRESTGDSTGSGQGGDGGDQGEKEKGEDKGNNKNNLEGDLNEKGGHKGSREKLEGGRGDRHFERGDRDRDRERDNRYGGNDRDRRYGGGDKGRGGDTRQQKPRRMDSYEQQRGEQGKRDNRTPDREYGGRSSQEKEKSGVEKTKSGERLDKEKEEFGGNDYDSNRGHGRGGRGGGGGKESRFGGVYQPRGGSQGGDRGDRDRDRDRGGWGRDRDSGDKQRDGGGRNRGRGRDFYDKPGGGRRMEEERRGGGDNKEESDGKKGGDKDSDLSNKGSVEDLGQREKGKGGKGEKGERDGEKGGVKKSPGTQRRSQNAAQNRGGGRLQGYGPPSDKNPFGSSGGGHEQDGGKSGGDGGVDKQNSKPAPVPLMALGDISPPGNMQGSKVGGERGGRGGSGVERGARGGSGRGSMPQRGMGGRGDSDYGRDGGYRSSGQGSNKSSGGDRGGRGTGRSGGGGDAKPLMSINSNDVEGSNEWGVGGESAGDSAGDSGEDDQMNKRSAGGQRKDGGGRWVFKITFYF